MGIIEDNNNERIVAEAPKHLNGRNFKIEEKMLLNENVEREHVTCLTFDVGNISKFVAIQHIWW